MRVDLVIAERSKPRDCSEAALDAKIKGLRDENDRLKQEMYALRDKQRSNHGRLEILREQGGYQRQVLREQTREIAEVISVVEEVFLEYEDWVRRSMGFRLSTPRMDLASC
ncbi:hypothetical protein EV126DRAFT_436605 [Verticillium dahliae]|nr:hypothetical protein EV126DRAFT_436605 [Verticillium dahliae]